MQVRRADVDTYVILQLLTLRHRRIGWQRSIFERTASVTANIRAMRR